MTVDELLRSLSGAFPAFNAKALEAWGPVFRSTMEKHEGARLAEAWTSTLSTFTAAKSKALFPVPADFLANMPGTLPKLPSDGPKLDLKGHDARKRRLMDAWRRDQGRRAANGVPEIMRALEFIAEKIAGLQAWQENPAPVLLTRKQVRLAYHRAISAQRRVEHGKPGKNGDEWWEQIKAIAARWGIETKAADWDEPKRKAKPLETVGQILDGAAA